MLGPSSIRIGELRVRARDRRRVSRPKIEHLLGTAQLLPPELPPRAVLIVRHLDDPIPGRLVGSRRSLTADQEWQRAVRTSLAARLGQARRPKDGPAHAGVESVLFADHAELLAYLLRDLALGSAWSRWWWASILRPLPRQPAVVADRLLRESSIEIPAVIDLLDRDGDLLPVLGLLPAAAAPSIAELILAQHGLSRAAGAQRLGLWAHQLDAPGLSASTLREVEEAFVLQLPAALGSVRRYVGVSSGATLWLVALALATRRARRWLHGTETEAGGRGKRRAESTHRTRIQPPSSTADVTNGSARGGAIELLANDGPTGVDRDSEANADPLPIASSRGCAAAGSPSGDARATGVTGASDTGPDVEPQQHQTKVTPAILDDTVVRTRLGGIFYLVNLLSELELLACFEPDWHLVSRLGAWGLLEAVGLGLLGEWEPDPIWALLAELGQRGPHEPLGAELGNPGEYFLPERCREKPGGEYRWARGGGRVGVWSGRGYVVLEASGTEEVLAASISRAGLDLPPSGREDFGRMPLARGSVLESSRLSAPLCWWLGRAVPYVRLRLGQRLRDDARGLEPAQLLRLPAQIHPSNTHIDVIVSQRDASVTVRRAGLDRDPGWRPELARVVLFHFH